VGMKKTNNKHEIYDQAQNHRKKKNEHCKFSGMLLVEAFEIRYPKKKNNCLIK
jgi:hypothetical protein